jgi:AcrR family transcriptional regulator
MGSKGISTRARIVAATADLMQRRPLRDLRVAEIGQLAAVSSSTFYLYFASVAEAGLAAVGEVQQATPEILAVLESEWTEVNIFDKAKAFVHAHLAVWDAHHALLRVRNFVADEGDKRFYDCRRKAVERIHLGLQEKIEQMQGKLPPSMRLDPPSTASVLLAMLERVAALVRMPSAHKATRPRQIETAAFLVASAVMGRLPNGAKSALSPRGRKKDTDEGSRKALATEN